MLAWASQPATLQIGDTGCDVVEWQELLNRWLDAPGSTSVTGVPSLAVDGDFGPFTQRLTRRFQEMHGVPADGAVGPVTRAAYQSMPALLAEGTKAQAHRPLLASGTAGPEVAAWQRALNLWFSIRGRGDEAVAVDAVFGPVTERATRVLQEAEHITVDGLVGAQTQAALLSALALVNTAELREPSGSRSAALAPAETAAPAAGICDTAAGSLVVITLGSDAPSARCTVVAGDQRLRVVNGALAVTVWLADFRVDLDPDEQWTIAAPFGNYLAPGIHTIHVSIYGGAGPQLWLTR
jgi:peptidoglycan hydrolase-like protein with peptidoglycan-binding domain